MRTFPPSVLKLASIGALSLAIVGMGQAQSPDALAIKGPLTIKATVSQQAMLSPEDKKSYLEYLKSFLAKRYQEQNVPADKVDERIANYLRTVELGERKLRMTVTYETDGTRYVYKEKHEPSDDVFSGAPFEQTVLFDGTTFYQIMNAGTIVNFGADSVGRYPRWVPFPGLGLPMAALVREGQLKAPVVKEGYDSRIVASARVASAPNTPFGYVDGLLKSRTVEGVPQVEEVIVGDPSIEHEEWRFSGHRRLGDQWAAQNVKWTSFVKIGESATLKPFAERTYTLDSLAAAPIDDGAFKLSKYAVKGARVRETTNDRKRLEYDYDPALSLDEMRKRPANQDLNPPTKTGGTSKLLAPIPIGAGISGVGLVGFVYLRRKARDIL
ncbi:hypothetical protein EON79_07905 [bacterium]|nr:MAG: hypothetical protein EON79_07905 [bacterium]